MSLMKKKEQESCSRHVVVSQPTHRKNTVPGHLILFSLLMALTWTDVHLETLSSEQRKSKNEKKSSDRKVLQVLWSNGCK